MALLMMIASEFPDEPDLSEN